MSVTQIIVTNEKWLGHSHPGFRIEGTGTGTGLIGACSKTVFARPLSLIATTHNPVCGCYFISLTRQIREIEMSHQYRCTANIAGKKENWSFTKSRWSSNLARATLCLAVASGVLALTPRNAEAMIHVSNSTVYPK